MGKKIKNRNSIEIYCQFCTVKTEPFLNSHLGLKKEKTVNFIRKSNS